MTKIRDAGGGDFLRPDAKVSQLATLVSIPAAPSKGSISWKISTANVL
jgi:hypothetical protein